MYEIDINLNSELLIKVVVIDTQLICDEGSDEDKKDYIKRVAAKINYSSKVNAPYFIVAGHYPVWSVGVTGSNPCMIRDVRPLLHQNRVDAYFCGHDHTMEHLTDNYMNETVEYLISGSANFVDDSTPNMNTVPVNSLKFTWKTSEDPYIGCKNCSGSAYLT